MDLRNQVASLESARKLEELGVKQGGLFYFTDYDTLPNPDFEYRDMLLLHASQFDDDIDYLIEKGYEIIPAYTSSELGEMLPEFIKGRRFFYLAKDNGWNIFYSNTYDMCHETKCPEVQGDTNLAEAMAKMLIWLLENKHITAEEINKEAK